MAKQKTSTKLTTNLINNTLEGVDDRGVSVSLSSHNLGAPPHGVRCFDGPRF